MEIVEKLNKTLLNKGLKICSLDIGIYKQAALMYTQLENAVAVLSDMQENKSYVYSSETAEVLGLKFKDNPMEIQSIWEEEILKKIHPDDKLKKYIHELRFFKMIDSLKSTERSAYHVLSRIRMKDKNDQYTFVQHKMFYIYSPENEKLRFALCLYTVSIDQSSGMTPEFLIVNSIKGDVLIEDRLNFKNILSVRELEVLKYVGEGFTSKEIADFLSISINTVSRHRQNILEKLKVKNSVQAFNDNFC
ncbi:response regulator transcription factor [Chryseobacterium sp. JUb7]|uniref:response regulator transcription factor n=1 Tax=Chryseobacterium sp. JUb7 TaxID=2940599 RepID=UPI00216741CA|nr:helix-turn-helix transcriptional regulator [Chryseobacterium sp. JUb7]MCS3529286.1 DNA-binding CsgD family transcriptional regulator [Chryseobacterium sp. JUb7]